MGPRRTGVGIGGHCAWGQAVVVVVIPHSLPGPFPMPIAETATVADFARIVSPGTGAPPHTSPLLIAPVPMVEHVGILDRGYGGVCCAGKLGEGGTTLRGGRNRRRRWISLGYVLGIAVVIVLIIGLILVILPDPLAH